MMNKLNRVLLVCLCGLPTSALAEFNKIYHPYVELHEREIEYGAVWRDVNNENILLQKASVGYAWAERWFGEIYLLTESITHEGQQIRGYEAEVKWQITEQGEYWADWGLLMEAGGADDINRRELALGVLIEKDITSTWASTVNIFAEYEYGADIQDEFETALRAQLRYRYSPLYEPAIEVSIDDQDFAAGFSLNSVQRISTGKQLHWELAWLFGLNADTPENNLRLGIEVEF